MSNDHMVNGVMPQNIAQWEKCRWVMVQAPAGYDRFHGDVQIGQNSSARGFCGFDHHHEDDSVVSVLVGCRGGHRACHGAGLPGVVQAEAGRVAHASEVSGPDGLAHLQPKSVREDWSTTKGEGSYVASAP